MMTSANHPVPEGRAAGKALTVLGPIEPAKVGITTTHEHLFIDFKAVLTPPDPASERGLMHQKVGIENLGWIRYHWTSNIDNLEVLDEGVTTREAGHYFNAGGATLVDVTSNGLGRDPRALVRVSRATGLNVVMGAGYYVGSTHPEWFSRTPVEEIAAGIVRDVQVGVGTTGIRSGIIGEIGCSWPWTENEKKSVHAAVLAQLETGAPLLIHPGRNERAPLEIIAAIDKWGGDLSRTVMGHIERTVYDRGVLRDIAATGVYVNFDLFGHESSFYPLAADTYMPADHERIDMIDFLQSQAFANRILLAHDICTKHRLKTYGGHGWDHILTRVVPWMRARGFAEEDVRLILVDNPTRMLTFN